MEEQQKMLNHTLELVRERESIVWDGYSADYADDLMGLVNMAKPYVGSQDYYSKAVVKEALTTTAVLISHYEDYEPADDEEDDSTENLASLREFKALLTDSTTQGTEATPTAEDLEALLYMVGSTASLNQIISADTEAFQNLVGAVENANSFIEENRGEVDESDFIYQRMFKEASKGADYLYEHYDAMSRSLCVEEPEEEN